MSFSHPARLQSDSLTDAKLSSWSPPSSPSSHLPHLHPSSHPPPLLHPSILLISPSSSPQHLPNSPIILSSSSFQSSPSPYSSILLILILHASSSSPSPYPCVHLILTSPHPPYLPILTVLPEPSDLFSHIGAPNCISGTNLSSSSLLTPGAPIAGFLPKLLV